MRLQVCLALTACILAASLDGCSYAPQETRAAYQPVTDTTAAAKPLAMLPSAAGSIVSVLESRTAGVYSQRIILSGDAATDGENAVIVQIDQSERRTADLSVLPKPTVDSIARELDSNFPSTEMQISRAWGHNEFGPFGYAFGKAAGKVNCLYAWQFWPGATLGLVDDPQASAAAASMPSAPISIRVRLCRKGMSEAQGVSLVREMEVYPINGGAPYHDTLYAGIGPVAAGDALQAAGAPTGFFGGGTTPAVNGNPKAAKPHRQIGQRRTKPPRNLSFGSPPASSPAPAGVMVPLPPGGASPAAASAVNPLLAPLQAAPPPRAGPVAPADDMPLPGAAAAPNPVAAPAPRRGSAMPLPN